MGLLMERGGLQRDDDLGGHEARPFARSRRTELPAACSTLLRSLLLIQAPLSVAPESEARVSSQLLSTLFFVCISSQWSSSFSPCRSFILFSFSPSPSPSVNSSPASSN